MNETALKRVRIVLVRPSHPGNVGAVARAMKTMGQDRLYLVQPRSFPAAEATARAAGADDVLAQARLCDSLAQAIGECGLVLGTTARTRSLPWPTLGPGAAAACVLEQASRGEAALIFGPERSGLDNRELAYCHQAVRIPTAPGFSSLNVAAAVQVLCYELFVAATGDVSGMVEEAPPGLPPVSGDEMERFYAHLEQCLIELDFLDFARPRRLMLRLRRLFNRAMPDRNELGILRGILAAAQQAARRRDATH